MLSHSSQDGTALSGMPFLHHWWQMFTIQLARLSLLQRWLRLTLVASMTIGGLLVAWMGLVPMAEAHPQATQASQAPLTTTASTTVQH